MESNNCMEKLKHAGVMREICGIVWMTVKLVVLHQIQ